MKKIGLREANQNFSFYMKSVKHGEKVLITDRGKPIAAIVPITEASSLQGKLAKLEDEGLISLAKKQGSLPDFKPLNIPAVSLSRGIVEERKES